MFVLLLVLSSLITISQSRPPEYPIWPKTCSFKRLDDMKPRAYPYITSYPSSQDECEGACKWDAHCGLYKWDTGSSGSGCERYQMTEMMWGEVEGLNADDMWQSDSSSRSGTKLCKAEYQPPTNCIEYQYTEGRYPNSDSIASIFTYTDSPTLYQEQCKHLCELYSACRSAWYQVSPVGHRHCKLFKTSLADGAGECPRHGNTQCHTYEKRCAARATSSQPRRTTSSLSTIIITIAVISSFLF